MHSGIREPDDPPPLVFQILGPFRIVCLLPVVGVAVYFDDEVCCGAGEIHDVFTDR